MLKRRHQGKYGRERPEEFGQMGKIARLTPRDGISADLQWSAIAWPRLPLEKR
jgi:hypothetical protein